MPIFVVSTLTSLHLVSTFCQYSHGIHEYMNSCPMKARHYYRMTQKLIFHTVFHQCLLHFLVILTRFQGVILITLPLPGTSFLHVLTSANPFFARGR